MKVRVKRRAKREDMWRGDVPSRWHFWNDGVSSSFIAMFLDCMEQTRLFFVEGWKQTDEPIYFAYGTCFHWMIENTIGKPTPPKPPQIGKLIKQYDAEWRKERKNAHVTERALEQHAEVCKLVRVVFPEYVHRWLGDWGGKYPGGVQKGIARPAKWVGIEQQFRVPYKFADGKITYIVGTRDQIFVTKKRERFNFDTKCMSRIVNDDIQETLPENFQQMLYMWADWRLNSRPPAGCVMNIARRPGLYRGVNESLDEYAKKVALDVQKRWEHYFIRFQLEVTKGELLEFEQKVLAPIMRTIRMWWEGTLPHFRNQNALITKYGRCAMFQPIVKGNFEGHHRVADPMAYQKRLN